MNRSLPEDINYHLFYGKDDSVSKGRALDERAYADAEGKYGFDTDHVRILEDRDVFMKYSEVLSDQFFSE